MGIREEMLRRRRVREEQQEQDESEEGSMGGVTRILKAPMLDEIMKQTQEIGEALDEG